MKLNRKCGKDQKEKVSGSPLTVGLSLTLRIQVLRWGKGVEELRIVEGAAELQIAGGGFEPR